MNNSDELAKALAGRYSIESELGHGGMAVVYLARDLRHGRQVAVKVLRPDVATAVVAERFVQEISLSARLIHQNILALHDSGEASGMLYYVMPYVNGPTLGQRLKNEIQLPIEDVLAIAGQVAAALDYAHAEGVVHRDIKPDNILLLGKHVLVADFGIARAVSGATSAPLTDGRVVLGTPAYMSPEQCTPGNPVDSRSDVYSLGCVVYEMIAGVPPFRGATAEMTMRHHLISPLPSVCAERTNCPQALDDIIRRALAKTPADRYRTAGEFSTALDRAGGIEGEGKFSGASRTPGAARRTFGWKGVTLAAAIVLAVAMAGLLTWRRFTQASVADAGPRIVVSEFENLTGDKSLDNLGITAVDWLTEGLQSTGITTSVPTESAIGVSRFVRARLGPGAKDPSAEIASETGADIVVSGRIYKKTRDSVEYQIQVYDATARRLIGAIPVVTSVTDPLAGIVAARTKLMGLLAYRVDSRLDASLARLPDPPSYEAYRDFSRGLDRYLQSDFTAAIPFFTAARAHDSAFATPLLFASISLSNVRRYREADSLLAELSAVRYRLSPFHQAWLDYRRNFLAGNRQGALSAVRALDSVAPGTKATYNHALEALENGYVEEAVATLHSLPAERGPMRGWIPYYHVLGTAYHLLNRFSEEAAVGDDVRRRYPNRLFAFLPTVRALAAKGDTAALRQLLSSAAGVPRDPYGTSLSQLLVEAAEELRAHGRAAHSRLFYSMALQQLASASKPAIGHDDLLLRGRAEMGLGHWTQAEGTFRALVRTDSAAVAYHGFLGAVLAQLHKTAEARMILAALERERRPYLYGQVDVAQARIAAALGDPDAAVSHLARAFSEGLQFDLWIHRDPDFESLRSLTRFRAMVAPKR